MPDGKIGVFPVKKNGIERPAAFSLAAGVAVLLVVLAVYLGESEFSDETLFFLLAALRYSSFFVCICSVFLFGVSVVNIIRKPSFASALLIFLSLCSAFLGAGIIFMDAVIISFTGGNG